MAAGIALSVCCWTAARALPNGDLPAAAGAGLALIVAFLFLRQERAVTDPTLLEILLSLPALLGPGLVAAATTYGKPLIHSPQVAALLALGGGLLAALSLVKLGRSFAIFPARRTLVTGGPYRLVRHPAYLGELLATLGLLARAVTPAALAAALLVLFAVMLRIRLEEALLAPDPAAAEYRSRVRWRLIPWLW